MESSAPTTVKPPEKAVRDQLLMDAVADELGIEVVKRPHRAAGADIAPVRHPAPAAGGLLQQNNQLLAVYADVRRGTAVPPWSGGHRHRHRRDRHRYQRVLRPRRRTRSRTPPTRNKYQPRESSARNADSESPATAAGNDVGAVG